MDRQQVYPGQILPETTLLNMAKDSMIGLAKLSAAILGTSTIANGLACTPNSPAALNVIVGAGEIYSLQNIDSTAFSSLASDTAHQIVKQGILLDPVTLATPAPATGGFSVVYLIQATFTETDSNPVVLPYYNASNPAQAYSGPANAGTTNNTVRKGLVTVTAKVGIAAATGTQTTPAPDAGYVGLYAVTVANGQASVVAGNIVSVAGSPLLSTSLLAAMQNGLYGYALDTGTANVYQVAYSPAVTSVVDGMVLRFKAKTANTGASTFSPNGLTAQPIIAGDHAAIGGGDIIANGDVWVQWNSTLAAWILVDSTGGYIKSPTAPVGDNSAKLATTALLNSLAFHGNCRISKSGANLLLSPLNGNKLMVNGTVQAIPSAGITLAPTGLLATTLYYIYAYMNAGVMTLEASTTGHSTDANTGVEIKTGDATRTLVGMAYCKTAATFTDSDSQRLVASWSNRSARKLYNLFSAVRSSTSTVLAEISSEIRCEFICWADESCKATFFGEASNSAGANQNSALGWDGAANFDGVLQTQSTSPAMFCAPGNRTLSEGFHYATGLGALSSGTGTWGISSTGAVSYINGMIG